MLPENFPDEIINLIKGFQDGTFKPHWILPEP
nr:MAG TPA: hypothetical protein [Caudoviricetes sp.]